MSDLQAKKDLQINGKICPMKIDEILRQIHTLPTEERVKLAQKLLGHDHGLTVVLGSNNVINNSFALQLNGSVDEIRHQLKELPPEILEQLLKAIPKGSASRCAIRIAEDKI